MEDTIVAPVAVLSPDQLIAYRCICGAKNWHEVCEVGRVVQCCCDRCYAVPSPPTLGLMECEAVRGWHAMTFGYGTMPKMVATVPPRHEANVKRLNGLTSFLLGVIVALLLSILMRGVGL